MKGGTENNRQTRSGGLHSHQHPASSSFMQNLKSPKGKPIRWLPVHATSQAPSLSFFKLKASRMAMMNASMAHGILFEYPGIGVKKASSRVNHGEGRTG
ncbi:hypothetical protein QR685DRAFT_315692 [Neurospora intermedia]|uniref:Uncharacterized protein n=1 Tax=Neurospora intermedia TaxID=5142 RepID=A0ABR3DAJ5_NEUIN